MEETLRRSNRNIKQNKDQDFIYGEEFECFLPEKSVSEVNNRQHASDSEGSEWSSASTSSVPGIKKNWRVQTAPAFTILDNLPLLLMHTNC